MKHSNVQQQVPVLVLCLFVFVAATVLVTLPSASLPRRHVPRVPHDISAVTLDVQTAGRQSLGLGAPDPEKKIATLGTQQEGPPPVRFPFRECVMRFEFSPDGAETWCLAGWSGVFRGDDRGRALVFHQKTGSWENIPSPSDPAVFHDVAFSGDGKTTWITMSSDDDRTLRVRQRPTASKKWKWLAFSNPMPDGYTIVKNFWLSPNRMESWMYTSSCGLIRIRLKNNGVSQYVQSDFRQFNGIEHFTLVADYVNDLVFTSDSHFAICAASGGRVDGITKIDLRTGLSTDFAVHDTNGFEHLVMSPDDKTVWCIGNNSFLWCFDIESESWTHKCSSYDEMPISSIDSLVCSRDSQHVWIAGPEGIACYSPCTRKWISFTGDKWSASLLGLGHERARLSMSSDGKSVIGSHASGLAIFEIDGSGVYTIESDKPDARSSCSYIVPVPDSTKFLCVMEYDSGGGLFLLDMKERSLERLFDLNSLVTALAFSRSSNAWVAMRGSVYEIDISQSRVVRQHQVTASSTTAEKSRQPVNLK